MTICSLMKIHTSTVFLTESSIASTRHITWHIWDQNKIALVCFCNWKNNFFVPVVDAPLSSQSLGSILEFRKAASALKDAESTVRLGEIDVNKEKQLAASLNVTAVPSLRLYLSGDKNNPVYCPGKANITVLLMSPIHAFQ